MFHSDNQKASIIYLTVSFPYQSYDPRPLDERFRKPHQKRLHEPESYNNSEKSLNTVLVWC